MSAKLINIEYFRQVTLNDKEFALDVLEKSLLQSKSYESLIINAFNNGDFLEIKKLMQQLKSTALVFGMHDWAAEIKKIEMGDKTKFQEYTAVISSSLNSLKEFIVEAEKLKAELV